MSLALVVVLLRHCCAASTLASPADELFTGIDRLTAAVFLAAGAVGAATI